MKNLKGYKKEWLGLNGYVSVKDLQIAFVELAQERDPLFGSELV